jgi:hypothetical protein
MKTVLIAAALAAMASVPASAATHRPISMHGPTAEQVLPNSFEEQSREYYSDHYGGGAPGDAGLPLGHGTANSPGGVIGSW